MTHMILDVISFPFLMVFCPMGHGYPAFLFFWQFLSETASFHTQKIIILEHNKIFHGY